MKNVPSTSTQSAERIAARLAHAPSLPARPELAPIRRFSDIVIASDFLDPVEEIQQWLDPLARRGVLVRLASGEWQWAAVGPHRYQALAQAGLVGYFTLLQGELVLAAVAGLLVFSSLVWLQLPKRWYWTAMLVAGWLLWLFVAAAVPPAVTNDVYANIIVSFGLLAAAVWAVLSAVVLAVALGRAGGAAVGRLALYSLWALPAFILPYLLWVVNLLPVYYLALLLAAVLIGAVLVKGRMIASKQ